ncbi:MAG: NfeD family protein [Candidatus Thorarchaeota archaeon]|nr:MAG: NfeD family protein [Candidatus Thorarchaeota archaeon]
MSARVKFIVITIDELILVPIAIIIVYYFIPELLFQLTALLIAGSAIFVAAKYYLVYPSLQETGSHALYDLKGMKAIVVEPVTSRSGKVKVGAEIWDARCRDGLEIGSGTEVRILERESMKVLVAPGATEESKL